MVGAHAGAGHRARRVKDEIDPPHRSQAILLPGQIRMNGFDAWIGHDRRAIVKGEPHASALVEQRPGEMAADEAGATGHQRKTGREKHG